MGSDLIVSLYTSNSNPNRDWDHLDKKACGNSTRLQDHEGPYISYCSNNIGRFISVEVLDSNEDFYLCSLEAFGRWKEKGNINLLFSPFVNNVF